MKNNYNLYLLTPSTYGFITWVILLAILKLNIITVYVSLPAWLVFIVITAIYYLSMTLSVSIIKKDARFSNEFLQIKMSSIDKKIYTFSTIIGTTGLLIYIADFSTHLGGLAIFLYTLTDDPLAIRALAAEETSLGFQLSYFSWISIYYSANYAITKEKISKTKKINSIIILLTLFILNLFFIDRTRPVILFIIISFVFIIKRMHEKKGVLKFISLLGLGPIVIFFLIAIFTQKFDQDDGVIKNFLIYLLGGFGYFSDLLENPRSDQYFFRVFYPFGKLIQLIFDTSPVPSQILDFRNIPFETNVGTFLEPLLSDGGLLYTIIGSAVIILSIDWLGRIAIKNKTAIGKFIFANLVMINIFSFFVPKYNSTYLYLFILIFIGVKLFFKLKI